MISDFIIHGKEPSYSIKEQTVLRYWNELAVENESVNKLEQSGYIEARGRLW